MEPHKSPSFPPSSSPKLAWGSPALRPVASFPPGNNMSPFPNMNTPPHRPSFPGAWGSSFGPGSGSPQFARVPHPNSFRTPQPQSQHGSPHMPRQPWSDNRGNQRIHRFPKNQSPHGSPCSSPNVNPGGSDDITQYYHPSMLEDPWQNVPPLPVNHWQC